MKIIILLRVLWTAGAQKIAIREAKELTLLGHEVELVFLRGSLPPEYEEMLLGVKYKILSETGKSWLSPIYSYITKKFAPDRGNESRVDYNMIRKFPSYLKSKDVDYIICHDILAGLAGYYAFKKYGTKYSVFVHEKVALAKAFVLGKLWFKLEHKILANALFVFSITDKVGESVMKLHSIKAITNYPGMDINSVTPFEKKKNAFIAVSFWDYGRRPETYLDVIMRIPDFILYFVGNFRVEGLEQKVLREIEDRNLESRVFIMKNLKESELVELFNESKFSIRFGFGESGVGTSTIESIQNAVPVITNTDLGIAGLIKKYSCGLVLEKMDVTEIQKFIIKYNNQIMYSILQNNISKLCLDYSWRRHAQLLTRTL